MDDAPATALTRWLAAQAEARGGTGVLDDALAMERLGEAARTALAQLAGGAGRAAVDIPFISAGPKGPVHLRLDVTPDVVEALGAG